MDLSDLQIEVHDWSERNFPLRDPLHKLLGVVEEVGELAHAELKAVQGIRGYDAAKRDRKAKDAVGDAIIYLADYCNCRGFELDDIVRETWSRVQARDWVANPSTGGEAD